MFFKNFPDTIYKFGSNEPFVKFQNFGKAAILSEESVGNTTIYEKSRVLNVVFTELIRVSVSPTKFYVKNKRYQYVRSLPK